MILKYLKGICQRAQRAGPFGPMGPWARAQGPCAPLGLGPGPWARAHGPWARAHGPMGPGPALWALQYIPFRHMSICDNAISCHRHRKTEIKRRCHMKII